MPARKKQVKRTVEYPCQQCRLECDDGSIECSECLAWTHTACIDMSEDLLKRWEVEDMNFYCRGCSFLPDEAEGYEFFENGGFDYAKPLVSVSEDRLKTVASERLLLETYGVSLSHRHRIWARQLYGEVLEFLTNTHPMIRESYFDMERGLHAILYTDDMISDLKCSLRNYPDLEVTVHKPMEMGIICNSPDMKITPVLFTQRDLIRQSSQKSPVFYSMFFLHTDYEGSDAYEYFFCHMAKVLEGPVIQLRPYKSQLVINVLQVFFPESELIPSPHKVHVLTWGSKRLRFNELLELMDAIHCEARFQYMEMKRALIGVGNFNLAPQCKDYFIEGHSVTDKDTQFLEKRFIGHRVPDRFNEP